MRSSSSLFVISFTSTSDLRVLLYALLSALIFLDFLSMSLSSSTLAFVEFLFFSYFISISLICSLINSSLDSGRWLELIPPVFFFLLTFVFFSLFMVIYYTGCFALSGVVQVRSLDKLNMSLFASSLGFWILTSFSGCFSGLGFFISSFFKVFIDLGFLGCWILVF